MILHLENKTPSVCIRDLEKNHFAKFIFHQDYIQAVTSKNTVIIPDSIAPYVIDSWPFDSDFQLGNVEYKPRRTVKIGHKLLGGNTKNLHLIAGPCSVESKEQITTVAKALIKNGITSIRAGCFKPRTSPYSFMGLGEEGLLLLNDVREEFGLNIVTEARDATNIDLVLKYADVVQIGTKSMYDHGILSACGESDKTIMLKRGFGSTLQEFLQAAEFIMSAGNENVILCERGIRTFESKTRFTLDLCGVAFLKHHCNLPVVVDPSHALGHSYGIIDLSKAATAMEVDGLLIETHPSPKKALSDASQQIDLKELEQLCSSVQSLAKSLSLNII
ncbi:MAG: bifunctional 3-deoxy-7-phosphoheptulonate synthase/chorismate mutase [Crocinitomicaceae bacterium]|jgi:3-deoxy-7-phosphoheptulonate synthase|nr:bifunctional 3-deoxy-7-phosphoheptulonate synthase/chorismate mutase [Crocinitomicaceae bacterium]MBT5403570.1 bifunctional 3-deoxy-7-phosphoheptulonate synthase/chorismate mutase [Crocinitomicaceae bacterium]MBT6028899.1 bifunctional 3-deoxy-7-phosphoheptulonate synthase/chorismate mutase [Crocinitomicaceae bacterium]